MNVVEKRIKGERTNESLDGGPHIGSKMTISGRPEIGLEDVPWTLAAHRFDVLRTSIDPKMVQIPTGIFKNHIKEADIYKSIR